MNFFNWLLSFFRNKNDTGLRPDPRTQDEKDRDYLHEERVSTGPVTNPFGNVKITASPFTNIDQHQTLACVPHGIGTALAIERKADTGIYQSVSPMFAYRLRSNYPGGGSWPQQIFSIYKNVGAPTYETLPTPFTENEANALYIPEPMRLEAAIFKGKTYFAVQVPNNIETLAKISQQGHGVPICFFSTQSEWSREYPVILKPTLKRFDAEATLQHEVCILPYSGFIENGVRYVTIQDSALFGGLSIRHVSEAFIAARVYDAGYWDTVNIIGGGPRPRYTFTKTLNVGARGDEVRMMQTLLVSEGVLPTDCMTGYFGGISQAAVRAFQVKYKDAILTPVNLASPTGVWGPQCIKQANKLCSG